MCMHAGTVTVSDVQVGWQSPLNITGVAWTEPDHLGGRQLASIEQITSSATLLDIVRGTLLDCVIESSCHMQNSVTACLQLILV